MMEGSVEVQMYDAVFRKEGLLGMKLASAFRRYLCLKSLWGWCPSEAGSEGISSSFGIECGRLVLPLDPSSLVGCQDGRPALQRCSCKD